jgi:hypothetical protein
LAHPSSPPTQAPPARAHRIEPLADSCPLPPLPQAGPHGSARALRHQFSAPAPGHHHAHHILPQLPLPAPTAAAPPAPVQAAAAAQPPQRAVALAPQRVAAAQPQQAVVPQPQAQAQPPHQQQQQQQQQQQRQRRQRSQQRRSAGAPAGDNLDKA